MLSAILVMAIVAGVLAFKVKAPDVCAYTKTIVQDQPALTTCDLIHATTTFVTRQTAVGSPSQYAILIAKEGKGTPCPNTTADCPRFRTLTVEN